VGFIESAAASIIPLAVQQFRDRWPDVGLTLRELSVGRQSELLRSGRIDIGILRPPFDDSGLSTEEIVEERLIAAVPAHHALAGRGHITAKALRGEPLVSLERDVVPGLYDEVIALLQDADVGSQIAQEATSIQAVLGLVAAGLGISLLPESVQTLGRDGVTFVPLHSQRRSTMVMAWRQGEDTPLVEAFSASTRATAETVRAGKQRGRTTGPAKPQS
jgi:DNA-binding transcriptional LysR family regulator